MMDTNTPIVPARAFSAQRPNLAKDNDRDTREITIIAPNGTLLRIGKLI